MVKEKASENEKLYIINLRNGFKDSPITKRGNAAMRYLRSFIEKNVKGVSEVKISKGVNEKILKNGPKNPLHKIKVKTHLEGDAIKVMLPDEKEKKKKKRRVVKPQDTKTKLQEMLAAKKPVAQEHTNEKKKEEKPKATEKKNEKTEEKKFEEEITIDKK
ncbi:MAG: hypothetical protein GXO64_00080 [Candidatus Micrarchaeota archaeon]|nr:hypothetical protein [Candidatus Micrarchaeota archaeon]